MVTCEARFLCRITDVFRLLHALLQEAQVYHLIARSEYGLMVQILGGLITYLLLAIYCREQHQEPVSINRVRELRNQIANEAAEQQGQRAIKQGNSNKTQTKLYS
jgi:hypothetical protein